MSLRVDPASQYSLMPSFGKSIDPADRLSSQVTREIFSYLNASDLARCSQVSKQWKTLASDEALSKRAIVRTFAFGKEKWAKYFGDIGAEPPLPANIEAILKNPCPFFPEKSVAQTHMLVLIPKTINGKPLTLRSLEELVQEPREGYKTGYRYILEDAL